MYICMCGSNSLIASLELKIAAELVQLDLFHRVLDRVQQRCHQSVDIQGSEQSLQER